MNDLSPGAGDLVLMPAERADREHQVTDIIARLLHELFSDPRALGAMGDVIPRVIPWVRFLPPADLQITVTELRETATASPSVDTLGAASLLLSRWRKTAEIHAATAGSRLR